MRCHISVPPVIIIIHFWAALHLARTHTRSIDIYTRIYFLFNSFSLGHKFSSAAQSLYLHWTKWKTRHRVMVSHTQRQKQITNYNFPHSSFFQWLVCGVGWLAGWFVCALFFMCTHTHSLSLSIVFFGAKLHAVVSMFSVCVDVAW